MIAAPVLETMVWANSVIGNALYVLSVAYPSDGGI